MKKYKYTRTFTYQGKRYFVRGDTLEEIGRKKALKLRDLQEGKAAINGNMLMKDWVDVCTDTYKTNQSDTTQKNFKNRVAHDITAYIGEYPVRKVKPAQCQSIMNNLSGMSKSHVNKVFQYLKFFFKYAKVNGLIINDPTENLLKPRTRNVQSRRALTKQERDVVLEVAKTDRRYYIYLLMLLCGCRPSEAAECMGKDIQNINGYHMLHIRGTKNVFADRFVPVSDALYAIIGSTPKNEYIACYSDDRGGFKRDGHRKIDGNNRARLWASFKRELNIALGCKTYRNKLVPPFPLAPDLVPYCLRHEYCTDLARKGVDIRQAQKLMGHSDISMTANIYTNLDSNDTAMVATMLGATKNLIK